MAESLNSDTEANSDTEVLVSTISIRQNKNVYQVQLEIPSVYILGFKHDIRTKPQRQQLFNLMATLNSPSLIVSIGPKPCKLLHREVDSSSIYDEAKFDANEFSEKDDVSSNKFVANYIYDCLQVDIVESLALGLFKQFPDIKSVNADWLSSSKSGKGMLTAENNVISLR